MTPDEDHAFNTDQDRIEDSDHTPADQSAFETVDGFFAATQPSGALAADAPSEAAAPGQEHAFSGPAQAGVVADAASSAEPFAADPAAGDFLAVNPLADADPARDFLSFAYSDPAQDKPVAAVLGIRLRKAGQVFFFPSGGYGARMGSKVVVQLEHGPALGEVVSLLPESVLAAADADAQPQGAVLRLATAQDIAQESENTILTSEAAAFCKSCIRQRELDMKLVDVEVMHDRSKIIFFFTAPARIDFRELVKDLVRHYRTRIELRQIGVRHETQMVGAIGNCGMVCCCHSYLRKFAPVTIKMAKEQNLFLNPAKLSGMCGRLLCCLSFEQGNYEEFNRRCPKLGKRYMTDQGAFKVLRANLFSNTVVVLNENNEERELPLEEWDAMGPHRAEGPAPDQPRGGPRVEGGRKERRKERRRPDDRNDERHAGGERRIHGDREHGPDDRRRPGGRPGERHSDEHRPGGEGRAHDERFAGSGHHGHAFDEGRANDDGRGSDSHSATATEKE